MALRWVTYTYDYNGEEIEDGYWEEDGYEPEEQETEGELVELGGAESGGEENQGGGANNTDGNTGATDPPYTDHYETPISELPVGQRTALGGGSWATRNADGSVSYEDPDGSAYTKTADGNYITGSGKAAVTYNPKTGGFTDVSGKPYNPSASGFSIPTSIKKLLSDKEGNVDPLKLLKLGGAAVGASGMLSRLGGSSSSNSAGITGYQGKIPQYTATRHAPPTGKQISGNVTYTPMAAGGSLEAGGFVFPADFVSHVGNGSSEAGLRILAKRFGATPIKGKGDGMSDSIKTTIDGTQPARVANEEARLTKAQVDAAGGAKKLYAMMDNIRKARTGTKKQGKKIDPEKFMPGGIVQGYAPGGTVAPSGTTGMESSLSNWAGDYVTDMLAKGKALSDLPYKQYEGKLTADPSALQTKVSTGLQGVNFPGTLGASYTNMGAPTIGADGQPTGGGGLAASYMNPYLKNVLDPQMAEMRRNSQINNLTGIGAMTKAGAFGGGRQAIMQSEANQNLLAEQNKTIGQGYSNAYDRGMNQFNTEQRQGMDLVDLMSKQGAVDRGIQSEDIAAKKAQFEEARVNPYKMVQFEQSLLSGLPLESQSYSKAGVDGFTKFAQQFKTIDELLKALGQT